MANVPDLADLQLLTDVVTRGSIGAAAAAHGLSQPQASRRMTRLERQLGVAILVRSNRGTTLTAAGKVVVDWATLLLNAAQNFSSSVAMLRTTQRQDTSVAVSMTIAEHRAPAWLADMARRRPDVQVTVTVGNSAEVAGLVRDGNVALGFVETAARLPGLRRHRIGGDRLRVAVHPGHPWAGASGIAPRALAEAGVLVREPGSGTRDTLESALGAHGLTLTSGTSLASNSALKAAAVAGVGPVVLSELSLQPELADGRLVGVEVAGLDLRRDFWAVTRPHDALAEAAQEVLQTALRAGNSLCCYNESMPRQPLYAQVEDALAGRIRDRLRPGDRLPTEDDLIAEFGVSRITVRHAIQNLVGRGLVVTEQGRGTFVARRRIEQPLTALTGFVEDMEAVGLGASARVVTSEVRTADRHATAALRLPAGSATRFIERVRLADGRPVSFDQTWLPEEIGARVASEDLTEEPIFRLLEEQYGIPLIEATYRLEAVNADDALAASLETEPGAPVFRIARTTYTTGHRPIDYELLHYRGDAIAFVTKLTREPSD
jgi:GntR family transcriptional regulator